MPIPTTPDGIMIPWTPFGQQLLPHLYVVSWLGMCPDPQIDCHVYVLVGPTGLLFIDCGTPWGRPRLKANCAHWGLRLEDLQFVLLTHGHVDHGAGGVYFQHRGVEFLGHPEIVIQNGADYLGAAAGDDPELHARYTLDGAIGEGDVVEECGLQVQVLHTPGHTRCSLSYLVTLDGARCLFSGDVLMADRRPGYRGDPGYSCTDLIASMRRLAATPYDHLFGGHSTHLDDRGAILRQALAEHDAGDWDDVPGAYRRPA